MINARIGSTTGLLAGDDSIVSPDDVWTARCELDAAATALLIPVCVALLALAEERVSGIYPMRPSGESVLVVAVKGSVAFVTPVTPASRLLRVAMVAASAAVSLDPHLAPNTSGWAEGGCFPPAPPDFPSRVG
jgi:hypothetical protein